MKILLINGSPHKNGTTNAALCEVARTLKEEGVDSEIIQVGNLPIRGCMGCYGCAKSGRCVIDDKVNEVAKMFEECDGLIVGSPVYYAAPAGTLICFLDRLFYSTKFDKRDKVGAAVVCARRGGCTASFDVLNKYFTISGMPVVSSSYWNQVHGANAEDASLDEEGYHLSDYAKEIRIRHADELLMKEYDENTQKIIETDKKYGKKYFFLYGLAWNTVGDLTFFSIILYMIYLLSTSQMQAGGFAATVGVIWNVRWILTDLIERLTKYPRHSLYIEKYLEFMRFEPRIRDGSRDVPDFESLELRNVSFSYEFSDHPKYKFHDEDHISKSAESDGKDVLKKVNMTIHKGDKIAIVGYNGAGKTTLIKLIMRLYDASEGEILYNGVDIREYDPEIYREKIGTVFQDYKIFATSIAENVMNGNYSEGDENTVIEALHAADFDEKLAKLDDGISTHLTREFNDAGTNLSGGESQKVAIARVFARKYPIVIMDEPSSALDPVAEYKLNQSILHETKEKTVIFISHRLSTTRIADKIYMFDKGCLIEEGSHEELLERDGKYAEMFRVQSKNYKE